MVAVIIIFLLSLLALAHSYALYPLLLQRWSRGRKQNPVIYSRKDKDLPRISILLAAYNEEKVIESKLRSTFATTYPLDKIEFLIGSDASSDRTEVIIEQYAAQYPQLKLVRFPGRTGKAGIVNALSDMAHHEVFILTDANVFFREDTLYELVKHYKNPEVALVGGNILNERVKVDGISVQEKAYLSRENLIKYREGILWGAMIGAFGGCYSVRKTHYAKVPPRFFMDDFYITMHALEKGGLAVNELTATCYEDVSNKISEEFRRKVRISIGNFQNLSRYWRLLWPPWSGLGFAFLSHKVLRWLGPIFLLLMLVSSMILMLVTETLFWQIVFWGQAAMFVVPVIDGFLKLIGVHIAVLRFASHFYLMNLALLVGLIKYIRGVKSNIWKPTERFQ